MSATPQDVLREAARILMRDGWTQGRIGDDDGPKCAAGAIKAACGVPMSDPWNTGWDEYLLAFESWLGVSVAPWNDAPERTAEDVILELKRAAEES